LVIERNLLGSGSSAKPLGGVRATFSDPGNFLLAQRSLEAYERFGAEFGVDIGLRQVGYLFLCRTKNELAAVESSTELQNRLGGSSEMVGPGRAAQLNPFIDPSVLLGASFSPRDGYAKPGQVVHGYADAARSLGVVFSEQTEVIGIDIYDDRVTAVRSARERAPARERHEAAERLSSWLHGNPSATDDRMLFSALPTIGCCSRLKRVST
jgi:sarcosine oxidase subunit beta